MPKAIFFDLDGTLTDSGPGIMNCAEPALAHFGIQVRHRDELRAFVGPPLRQSFARFGVPEDLTGALLFLCDESQSGFITGVILPVDGGFSAYSGV